ncbi:MAG: polymerase delta subunit [Actinomycetia bacterium]|nr:polymerase delta subunit [Actinomycetes bacterium]
MTAPVYLVRGNDPLLRHDALMTLLVELLDGEDRSLVVEDLTIPGRTGEGDEVGGSEGRSNVVAAASNAALSPPFMTARRIVVLHDVGALTNAEAAPLIEYLADPLPTTVLVCVAGGGTLPTNLTKAWKGQVTQVGPETEDTKSVLVNELNAAGVRLTPDALQEVSDHFGEDASRARSLVDTLRSAYGDEAPRLNLTQIGPYLGETGSVPVYQLANAIEAGDVPGALALLERMLNVTTSAQPKPMHPLQIIGLLQNQYRRLAKLDDPSIRTDQDAVAALGGKVKPYPAKKALAHSRALGTDGIRTAYGYLAQADLDLKGKRAIPEQAVVEILVARLAGLTNRSRVRH